MDGRLIDLLTSILAVALIFEFVASVVSTIYIFRIYRRGTNSSRVFRMLYRSDIIKIFAGLWIGGIAVYRLVEYPTPLPIWTTPISAFVVMVLLSPPIYHALTFRSLRRQRGDHTPPPLTSDD